MPGLLIAETPNKPSERRGLARLSESILFESIGKVDLNVDDVVMRGSAYLDRSIKSADFLLDSENQEQEISQS